jgi:hypothetical protein
MDGKLAGLEHLTQQEQLCGSAAKLASTGKRSRHGASRTTVRFPEQGGPDHVRAGQPPLRRALRHADAPFLRLLASPLMRRPGHVR